MPSIEPSGAVKSTKFAYFTRLIRASYISGVLILAHTLRKHGFICPLAVLFPCYRLEADAIEVLQNESESPGIRLQEC